MTNEILEKILQELVEIKIIQAKQEVNLQIHMKRSDMLEEAVALQKQQFQNELEPIKTHVNMVNGGVKLVIKLLGFVAIGLGAMTSMIKIISFFHQ